MARWFEEGYEPEEGNPVEDFKRVVNNPPNSLPIDGVARQLFYLGEWRRTNKIKKIIDL